MKSNRVRKVVGSYDVLLLMFVVILCAFGTIMVYSTSYYNADRFYSASEMYYDKQLRNLTVGAVFMILVSLLDYHIYIKKLWKRIRPIHAMYIACLGMQLFVAIGGYSANGSSRWMNVGGTGFQPSEFTKICVILMSAYFVTKYRDLLDTYKGVLPLIFPVALAGIVARHDFSTGVVLVAIIALVDVVVSGIKRYHIVIGAVVLILGLVLIFSTGYRAERISNFMNSETIDTGSQTVQGLYAIGSGGMYGKGLGEGLQKLGKIQEVHTDMIFTVVCEELGIAGAIIIILLFILLLWRIYYIAVNARDMFGSLICVGAFAHIASQTVINLFVVTNLIPATGIPLPFISYGGTSLVVLLIEMGLVLNVSKQIPEEGEENA
ncbi:MAG: FtsW/RodA/SpoVE family cell cycle protein [Lachnospiraceae bacterium]|nr:FtsW/RodA/SpoVE family cell cycle protein [Lachnospiraceae bacterium]